MVRKCIEKEERFAVLRPEPPESIFSDDDLMLKVLPDMSIMKWIEKNIIDEAGPIHNPDHLHLLDADICTLWASSGFEKHGRSVVGQCEQVMFRAGGWQKARQEQQMIEWFGHVPEFIITLDAMYCDQCSDAEFCALVEHELYHIAQAIDAFGDPKFKEDGNPKLKLQGHDVEEFHGVVRRYGASEQVKEMARLANLKPEVSAINISQSCGTCLLKLA